MQHAGVEQVIAATLLTDQVRGVLADAGVAPATVDGLKWVSWSQLFGSTTGPWHGYGGAAMTNFQVTVGYTRSFVAVFAASDLYAFGESSPVLVSEIIANDILFRELAGYGLTVLDRRLP